MGIILSALGGGADVLLKDMDARQKVEDEKNLYNYKSGVELDRAKTLEMFKEGIKNAPLQRIQQKAQSFAGQEIPQEQMPVTQVTGYNPTASEQGPAQPGFRGDIAAIKAGIAKLPDSPEKQAAAAQLDAQIAGDQSTSNGIINGATRKRTPEESLQAAAKDAMVNDPGAFAAYLEKIGRPQREDRRLDLSERRMDDQFEFQARRADRLDKLAELTAANAEARNSRLDSKADGVQERAELQSRRSSVVELMKSTEHELERNMTLAKDALDPAQQKMFQARIDRLNGDLAKYRTALESFSGDAIKPVVQVSAPEPELKYDAQGRAYRKGTDGRPVLVEPKKQAPALPAKASSDAPSVSAAPQGAISKYGDALLRRIASDPDEPQYAEAKAELARRSELSRKSQDARVNDDSFNPDYYK